MKRALAESEIQKFLRANLDFGWLTKQEILDAEERAVGYVCSLVLADGVVFTTGTAVEWENARRIAIAEALETIQARKTFLDTNGLAFGLDKIPTTSGFAAGFERGPTRLRAICEGLERWAWSQWIDRGCRLDLVAAQDAELSPLAKSLSRRFSTISQYSRVFQLQVEDSKIDINFGIVLGHFGNGLFAGSRATVGQDVWTHALVESVRNLDNFIFWNSEISSRKSNWYSDRVNYFGHDKRDAIQAIAAAQNKSWPSPEIELLVEVPTELSSYFVWRCLFRDFIPWHEGPTSRFVY